MSNTIKVPLNIFETLPSFVDYIEFWKIIWWETMFFNMFKLNDVIIKKIQLVISTMVAFKL